MKLNKFIYEKLDEIANMSDWSDVSADEIEEWIVDWYMDTFQEVGCDGGIPKARSPPMWLAGSRWYDRRAKKIKEAKIEEAKIEEGKVKKAEERSYELDEV